MPNPLNPLDWLKSAQDWFSKTEKSSGFRAYLIFLILVFGVGLWLVTLCEKAPFASFTGLGLIVLSVVAFIVLYFIKALRDPNFCRSEQHIQKVMQIELERMGNESRQIEGQVIEAQMLESAQTELPALPHATHGGTAEEVAQ